MGATNYSYMLYQSFCSKVLAAWLSVAANPHEPRYFNFSVNINIFMPASHFTFAVNLLFVTLSLYLKCILAAMAPIVKANSN